MNDQAIRLIALLREARQLTENLGGTLHTSIHCAGALPEAFAGAPLKHDIATVQPGGYAKRFYVHVVESELDLYCGHRDCSTDDIRDGIAKARAEVAKMCAVYEPQIGPLL